MVKRVAKTKEDKLPSYFQLVKFFGYDKKETSLKCRGINRIMEIKKSFYSGSGHVKLLACHTACSTMCSNFYESRHVVLSCSSESCTSESPCASCVKKRRKMIYFKMACNIILHLKNKTFYDNHVLSTWLGADKTPPSYVFKTKRQRKHNKEMKAYKRKLKEKEKEKK